VLRSSSLQLLQKDAAFVAVDCDDRLSSFAGALSKRGLIDSSQSLALWERLWERYGNERSVPTLSY
jgi:hypothetical protein